ncbi:MAG: hypothetical protein ABW166_17840 [Sedimenticola sp.]
MSQMTVRNIPEEDYEALKRVAAKNNRSAEAEVRHAIKNIVRFGSGEGIGSKLHAKYGGAIDDNYEFPRDKAPHEPIVFE